MAKISKSSINILDKILGDQIRMDSVTGITREIHLKLVDVLIIFFEYAIVDFQMAY